MFTLLFFFSLVSGSPFSLLSFSSIFLYHLTFPGYLTLSLSHSTLYRTVFFPFTLCPFCSSIPGYRVLCCLSLCSLACCFLPLEQNKKNESMCREKKCNTSPSPTNFFFLLSSFPLSSVFILVYLFASTLPYLLSSLPLYICFPL